jgi:uncharacterized damage-inducible protein DinB
MEEAWLSGKIENVAPVLMPAAHALVQAARDIEKAVEDLSDAQLWTKPNGAASVGFHLLHVAGSIDRLLTYARGKSLSAAQFAELAAENERQRAETAQTLAARAIGRIENAILEIKQISPERLFEARTVGRKRLPTNVFGLLFHIAEHTQRHVGQIVTTAKIARGAPADFSAR